MTKRTDWTAEEIRALLETNDDLVLRGLCILYQRQTEDEKILEDTCHSNGVGFNAADAAFGSSLAVQIQTRGWLSTRKNAHGLSQLDYARKMILKYSGQLAGYANAEAEEENARLEYWEQEAEAEARAEDAWLRVAEAGDEETRRDLMEHESWVEQERLYWEQMDQEWDDDVQDAHAHLEEEVPLAPLHKQVAQMLEMEEYTAQQFYRMIGKHMH